MKLLYIGVCRENLEKFYPEYIAGEFREGHITREELVETIEKDGIDVLMVDVFNFVFDSALLEELRGRVRQINFLYQSVSSLIDCDKAAECDIKITKLPDDVYCNEVAEFALAQLLCASKGLVQFDQSVRQGQWDQALTTNLTLRGKTLGVVGFGNIGRRIVELCGCWGMEILVVKRDLARHPSIANVSWVGIDQLLQESDCVVLAVPLTEETRQMLDEKTIQRMKRHAILINVSRGDLVDEEAVIAALKDGHLGYYCAHVFRQEPLPIGDPLSTCEKTILSPHVAWCTGETLRRSFELWSKQLIPNDLGGAGRSSLSSKGMA
jgi:phosphoglycerate dehydrogenase-like enzyme